MPSFQARYFLAAGETVPIRVQRVEAIDHAEAEALARAQLAVGETVFDVADYDDEFRRGTPHAHTPSRSPLILGLPDLRQTTDRLSMFIRNNPNASMAMAVGIGLVVGMRGSRPRIVRVGVDRR
jgi:hypothetical protein